MYSNGTVTSNHNSRRKIDETGNSYGKLLVIQEDTRIKKSHAYWCCLCECGSVVTVDGLKLRSHHTNSCGCLKRKHGYSQLPEYQSYQKMIDRCYNLQADNYEYYGGRGIQVCDKWRSDINAFMLDMGKRPGKNYTLDRIDVNGDYGPDNCRWSDVKIQQRNKRVCQKSRTGVRGVIPYKDKYQANIRVNGKLHHLGYFETIAEAAQARKQAEIRFWGNA